MDTISAGEFNSLTDLAHQLSKLIAFTVVR